MRPLGIAVDSVNVYWVDYTGGTVMQVPKSPLGSGTPVLLASNQNKPFAIAVDSSGLYWTNLASGNPGTGSGAGSIMMLAPGAATPVTLATGQLDPVAIVLTPTTIYWCNYDSANGNIVKLAK